MPFADLPHRFYDHFARNSPPPVRSITRFVKISATNHRCWAEIDLDALRHNAAAVRARVGGVVKIMAIVKADAYGHGVLPVVCALVDSVEMFGVANLEEACEISAEAGSRAIHLLSPALPAERADIVARGFLPSISTVEEAAAFSALAASGKRVPVHLNIDTGMGRIGVWQAEALAALREIVAMPGIEVTGIASHFPVSDEDDRFTETQHARFCALLSECGAGGVSGAVSHIANSAGLIVFGPESGGMVRAGLMLYGCSPRAEFQPRLQPVLTWKTRVTLVREIGAGRTVSYGRTFTAKHPMHVATLAVGYADGYQRHLTGRDAEVLIRGKRCPVLGRVTMDQIMVDCSGLTGVQAGEEVVLLGRDGNDEISATELAQKAGAIPWEIFTGIGRRVARIVSPGC